MHDTSSSRPHRRQRTGRTAAWCAAFLCLVAQACTSGSSEARLAGKISGVKELDVYVYAEDNDFAGIDTLSLSSGHFALTVPLSRPTVLTLAFPNGVELPIVAAPGDEIEIAGSASDLGQTHIKGSEENEALTAFRQAHGRKNEAEQRKEVARYVQNHPECLSAYALFRQYIAKRPIIDTAQAIALLDTLRANQPATWCVQHLAARMLPVWRVREGNPVPPFRALTIQGDTITHDSLLGHPTLIVFFASWASECNGMLDVCRNLRRDYGNRFRLLFVSLDSDTAACRRHLRVDSLDAEPAVCDGVAMSSPLARTLGFQYLPGGLLLNSNGVIVSRELQTKTMRAQIEALFDTKE